MTKKSSDRHVGRRENIWFPWEEHEAMLKAMDAQKERNKSNFIRTAVHNYAAFVEKEEDKKGQLQEARKGKCETMSTQTFRLPDDETSAKIRKFAEERSLSFNDACVFCYTHSADGTPVEERHRVKIPACRPVRHYLEGRVDGRERRSPTGRTLGNITAWSVSQELWKAQGMNCAVMRTPTPPQNDRETANSVDSRRDGELSN